MERFYQNTTKAIRKNRWLYRVVVILSQMLPWFFVFAYLVTLLVLLATWNLKWIFFLIVPAVSVLATTLLRNQLNFPRPFQVYSYTPLVEHKTGKSFPSRHTTCAFAIGIGCLYLNIGYGVFMMILAVAVAVARVLCGVHFIRDVLAGAGISMLFSFLGYFFVAQWCGL